MIARRALADATRILSGPTPRLDAELLLAHHLGCSREDLLLRRLDHDIDTEAYQALITRRAAGEPVAYITGVRSFWTFDLIVTPDVLIPRADSEIVVETLLAHVPADTPLRILDLGTGSGALLIALLHERPLAQGVAVDMSQAALNVARRNAIMCGVEARMQFVQSNWGAALRGPFDVIISNPPYIAEGADLSVDVAGYEPASALFAGAQGLDDYARIIPDLARLLAPDGVVALEIGWDQGQSVCAMAEKAGFAAKLHQDLAGRDRCIILRQC